MRLQEGLDHYAKLVIWKLSVLQVDGGYVGLVCALNLHAQKYKHSISCWQVNVLHHFTIVTPFHSS